MSRLELSCLVVVAIRVQVGTTTYNFYVLNFAYPYHLRVIDDIGYCRFGCSFISIKTAEGQISRSRSIPSSLNQMYTSYYFRSASIFSRILNFKATKDPPRKATLIGEYYCSLLPPAFLQTGDNTGILRYLRATFQRISQIL